MALSIVASGVLSTETSVFSKIVQTNIISASAAISYGDWEYEVNVLDPHTVTLTKYNGNDEYVFIPENIDGHTVTKLGEGLFQGNTIITRVAIPQAVDKIGDYAFANTPNLESVSLSTVLDEIGDHAFFNSGISNILIPSANVIGCNAFENCVNLKSIKLPNNLETLEYRAFYGCNSLESVSIPASVTWLGSEAFANCTSLKQATFKKYPDHLTGNIFANCTALENINYHNDDKRFVHDIIYTGMIEGCPNFKKVNNENIVTYESHRYNPYSKPIMREDFMEEVMKDFVYVDEHRISFFEEYLKGTIAYIAGTNTHIIGSSTVLTTTQKIKALHDWVCNNVDYAYDSNHEPDLSWENASDSTVFLQKFAICEGYARALTLLLREAGIEAYFVHNPGVHAWCMVKIGDYYFHVDACHDDTDSGPYYGYFLVSDKDVNTGNSHSKWEIASPWNSRIDYTLPQTPICERSLGDVYKDKNNRIDSKDVQLIMDYISNTVPMPDPSSLEFLLADVNCDGKIDLNDADIIDSWIDPFA
ncbi:MAG: leucine-rich repeat protein [Ruminococcus sp.]|uniref:leucine-rich repeat protein n=1 Tax=Ruminococcus sp. TaxID=41978 RepID=UPI0026010145|nr:leucine-rich repeat protein [Ruminococcus sp.]MCR5600754.1 leucine-rich repeat protein [Ruminococcus sp.]